MTAIPARAADGPSELSLVVIQLMKGPVYHDNRERLWEPLMRLRPRVSDYVGVLGLRLEVDERDGHAYLRSLTDGEGETPFPRLVARHTLPFHVSLLLALLRKRLAEFDASSAEARLVLRREQVVEMLRLYMPESSDEVKTVRAIDTHIRRSTHGAGYVSAELRRFRCERLAGLGAWRRTGGGGPRARRSVHRG